MADEKKTVAAKASVKVAKPAVKAEKAVKAVKPVKAEKALEGKAEKVVAVKPDAEKTPAPKAEKAVEAKPVKVEAPKAEKAVEAPKAEKVEAPKAAEAKPGEAKAVKAEAPKAVAPAQKPVAAPAPKAAVKAPVSEKYENRLIKKDNTEVAPALIKQFGYGSVMQAPKFEKIVINVGCGDATVNAKALEDSVNEIAVITGQHPVITKAKKSIATFKVRQGQAIGCKVTLRGLRMYEFYDKLVSIALPRVRDFRGISKNAFDGHGNYTLGIKEQLIFPEIDYDKISKIRGMDIVIVTTAQTDAEAFALLQLMGMPFRR
jgi:large subunit ribosomal protein L5